MNRPDAAFEQAVSGHRRLVICIKGSPDPDVLASAFACKRMCEALGKKCRIVATKPLALNQNRAFARRLALPFERVASFSKVARWADAYMVLDHPSPVVEGISDQLPCAVLLDHHEPVPPAVPVALRWCSRTVGSTSTLVSQILEGSFERLGFSPRDMRRMTTALLFGLQTDTDSFTLATDEDFTTVEFLSRFADVGVLKRLSAVPMSRATRSRLERAEANQILYRDWLMAGVGFVPYKSRDDIAIVADLMLRRQNPALVVVFALVHDDRRGRITLDASVRSANARLRLSNLVRSLATDGGGRKFKAAFQVKLDYFSTYADREALWTLVEKATVEKLKRARDAHYKVKLQSAVQNVVGAAGQLASSSSGSVRYALKDLIEQVRRRNRS